MSRNIIIDNINNNNVSRIEKGYDNIFILFRNEYKKGLLTYSALEAVEDYIEKNEELVYKNIIIAPSTTNKQSKLNDAVLYILWFSSNDNSYFNKDSIREKHIWKDVEWGKRAKNYSEKGKDPSNVWIPTEDDGKGKITEHVILGWRGVLERLYKMTYESEQDVWELNNTELDFENIEKHFDSEFEKFEETNWTDVDNSQSLSLNDNINKIDSTYEIKFKTSENMIEKSNSIQTIVTSPPYWDLKNYFKEGQIGHESYQEYLDRLLKVWEGCFNSLHDEGSMWININIRVKNKKPYLIPTEFIKQIRKKGYYLIDILIWHKSSSIPTSYNNLSDKYEFVLLFSKTEQIDIKFEGSFNDYKAPKLNHTNFWNINRKAGSVGKKFIHPAIYPTELVSRIIKISSNEKDYVLDPFLGSGTSLIAAINLNRNFIGYEYNEGFEELINTRIANELNSSNK